MKLPSKDDVEFAVGLAAKVGIAWGSLIGVCFLYGFWSVFGLNILHFMSVVDGIKLAVWPLIAAAVFMVGSFVAGQLLGQRQIKRLNPPERLPVEDLTPADYDKAVAHLKELTAYEKRLLGLKRRMEIVAGVGLIVGLVVLLYLIWVDHPVRWVVLGSYTALATVFIVFRLVGEDVESIAGTAIMVAVAAPIIAWGYGRTTAESLKRPGVGWYVQVTSDQAAAFGLGATASVKFIANTGSYTVLLVNDERLVVAPNDSLGPIQLHRDAFSELVGPTF